jgi:hypothetical protein
MKSKIVVITLSAVVLVLIILVVILPGEKAGQKTGTKSLVNSSYTLKKMPAIIMDGEVIPDQIQQVVTTTLSSGQTVKEGALLNGQGELAQFDGNIYINGDTVELLSLSQHVEVQIDEYSKPFLQENEMAQVTSISNNKEVYNFKIEAIPNIANASSGLSTYTVRLEGKNFFDLYSHVQVTFPVRAFYVESSYIKNGFVQVKKGDKIISEKVEVISQNGANYIESPSLRGGEKVISW